MPNNHEMLGEMISFLHTENHSSQALPDTEQQRFTLWRELINARPAHPLPESYLQWEDTFLKRYHNTKTSVGTDDCTSTSTPQIKTYHGDICHLAVDAIVNAANSEMLGCFIPGHHCIDNAIHTFAGSRLRLHCKKIMTARGRKQPIGDAILTPAYHLPARHVIHTVGPVIEKQRSVSPLRASLLKRCYQSCLQTAQQQQLHSIAFCCISTGEFGFPQAHAAEIAVHTVRQWLNEHQSSLTVIFNTFTKTDKQLYDQLLNERSTT